MTRSLLLTFLASISSLLILSGCLPEDNAEKTERDARNVEAQAQTYAQAFAQFSNRSLSALVNSQTWKAQLVTEGTLDLSLPDFGAQDMGNAGAYLSSALCIIDGEKNHLTWFSQTDSAGKVSLKGLGEGQIGLVAANIKDLAPDADLGVKQGGVITKHDGATLTLSGSCASLRIPESSAVMAVALPNLTEVVATQNKTLMRGQVCPEGFEGGITQSVAAKIATDGKVIIGGYIFASEIDAINNYGGTWSTVSNNCSSLIAAIDRSATEGATDALNIASIVGQSGDIADTLKGSLTNLKCQNVFKKTETDTQWADPAKEFDTCGEGDDITLLEDATIIEKRELRVEEEVIISKCPPYDGAVMIASGHAEFAGLPAALNGKDGTYSAQGLNGEVSIKKTTKFWEVFADYGDGRKTSEVTTTEMKGIDMQCRGTRTLRVDCSVLYPGMAASTNQGPVYRRSMNIIGWADAYTMEPNPITYSNAWSLQLQMNCTYVETQPATCSSGPQSRSFIATTPGQAVAWSQWIVTGSADNCPLPPSDGRDGGGQSESDLGRDVNGDGDTNDRVSDGL